MRKAGVQSIIFVLLLMIPLAYASIDLFGDRDDSVYEISENFGEEESDERESEKDKEVDEVDDVDFIVIHQKGVIFDPLLSSDFISKNRKINKRSKDILLPPPDTI